MFVAAPATPVRPTAPAIKAIIKKVTAQFNTVFLLLYGEI